MAKYLLTYHGGSAPEGTEEEIAAVYAAWSEWLGSAGDKLVDGGNPTAQTMTVGPDGAVANGNDDLSGYSLVEADSIDDAVAFAKASPHLAGGGSVAVRETMEM